MIAAAVTTRELAENPSINFNAGDHAISVQMPYADYTRLEQPQLAVMT